MKLYIPAAGASDKFEVKFTELAFDETSHLVLVLLFEEKHLAIGIWTSEIVT